MLAKLTRPRGRVATVVAAAVLLAGCGGGGSDGGDRTAPQRSVAGMRACLDGDPLFRDVRDLPAGQGGRTVLTPRQRALVVRAVRASRGALIARAGGPQQVGGTITEAPVRVFELYFFADAGAARDAASHVRPAGALDAVRALAPVVVVHYSFGIGDRAARVGLGAREVAPVERCLKETGYL